MSSDEFEPIDPDARSVSLEDVFLPISVVDGQTRCACWGALTVTVERHADVQVHWAKCQSCGDGGALQIAGTERARGTIQER